MFERFFPKKQEKITPDKVEKEKEIIAEEFLNLLSEIAGKLVQENQNALLIAKNNQVNNTWKRYIENLVEGNYPIFYIETGGIVRMGINLSNELVVVHSGDMPSIIKGESIEDVWNEIKDEYNPKIAQLINELNIDLE